MASDAATNARQAAVAALQPIANDEGIADIIASLTGEGEDGDTKITKALEGISAAQVALAKAEDVSVAEAYQVGKRLDQAARSLQAEYLTRHSVGFTKSEAANTEAERLRSRNFGKAA